MYTYFQQKGWILELVTQDLFDVAPAVVHDSIDFFRTLVLFRHHCRHPLREETDEIVLGLCVSV